MFAVASFSARILASATSPRASQNTRTIRSAGSPGCQSSQSITQTMPINSMMSPTDSTLDYRHS